MKERLRQYNIQRNSVGESCNEDSNSLKSRSSTPKDEPIEKEHSKAVPCRYWLKGLSQRSPVPSNNQISTSLWRLEKYASRAALFNNLENIFTFVTNRALCNLLREYEDFKTYPVPSAASKVRLESNFRDVVKLMQTISVPNLENVAEFAELGLCEAGTDENESSVVNFMKQFKSFRDEVESLYNSFVNEMKDLRDEFRNVHRGKMVSCIPDIEGRLEALAIYLERKNVEEAEQKMQLCITWVADRIRKALTIVEEVKTIVTPNLPVNSCSLVDDQSHYESAKSTICALKFEDIFGAQTPSNNEEVDCNFEDAKEVSPSCYLTPPEAQSTPRGSLSFAVLSQSGSGDEADLGGESEAGLEADPRYEREDIIHNVTVVYGNKVG